KGRMQITGQLGDVMKESVHIASSFLRAHADYLDLDLALFEAYDIHVHFPAGAIPKDGPSAGVTVLTSLASLMTQRRVKKRLAMTGEITLRGKVLPVGGIKEKVLAAKRAGIQEVILCEQNRKDILDIPESYIQGMQFFYVNNMLQVLDLALTHEPVKGAIKLTANTNHGPA
ncbi:MAG: S16 family serine protease, partial [Bacteroidia bacterium]